MKEHNSKSLLCNGYGSSEAGGANILSFDSNKENCIGKPLENVNLKVYDDEKKQYKGFDSAPAMGELLISSDTNGIAEYGGKECYQSVNIDGVNYLLTGDICRLEKDGNVSYIGRKKRGFQNIIQGNVYPETIEEVLEKNQKIIKAVVLPHFVEELDGNLVRVYLYIDKNVKNEISLIRELIVENFISEDSEISFLALPNEFKIVNEDVPYTKMQKIDYKHLLNDNINGNLYVVKQKDMLGSDKFDIVRVK